MIHFPGQYAQAQGSEETGEIGPLLAAGRDASEGPVSRTLCPSQIPEPDIIRCQEDTSFKSREFIMLQVSPPGQSQSPMRYLNPNRQQESGFSTHLTTHTNLNLTWDFIMFIKWTVLRTLPQVFLRRQPSSASPWCVQLSVSEEELKHFEDVLPSCLLLALTPSPQHNYNEAHPQQSWQAPTHAFSFFPRVKEFLKATLGLNPPLHPSVKANWVTPRTVASPHLQKGRRHIFRLLFVCTDHRHSAVPCGVSH